MQPALLLIDDHFAIAQALVSAFRDAGLDAVESLRPEELDVEGALRAVGRIEPSVALVDLDLGAAGSGLDFIRPLTDAGVRVVVFTASNASSDLAASVRAGAVGFLNKAEPFDVTTEYVLRIAEGEMLISEERKMELLELALESDAEARERVERFGSLTEREREVLASLVEGMNAKEIARAQGTAVGTVRNQIKAIRSKLGVQSQLAAVALAREHDFMR